MQRLIDMIFLEGSTRNLFLFSSVFVVVIWNYTLGNIVALLYHNGYSMLCQHML